METTLHRQLKQLYAPDESQIEVRVGRYRIDAVDGDELIEIQHGSLSAIRDKVTKLLDGKHKVRVVKPIIARRLLVRRSRKGGRVEGRRYSPKRGTVLDLFDDLVYFTRVFPRRGLTIEVPLVEIEEWRYPGHGRRRRWRRRDFQIEDQMLVELRETHRFRSARDLGRLLPNDLPSPFDTKDMSQRLDVSRWYAQRIAYCLRHMGTIKQVGKRGNALLYKRPRSRRAA